MLSVDQMSAFSRTVNLIRNRVKVINGILGYGCWGPKVPCIYLHVHGTHQVTFCGAVYARFGPYDQRGADSALARLDALLDGLWYALGGGVVKLA